MHRILATMCLRNPNTGSGLLACLLWTNREAPQSHRGRGKGVCMYVGSIYVGYVYEEGLVFGKQLEPGGPGVPKSSMYIYICGPLYV